MTMLSVVRMIGCCMTSRRLTMCVALVCLECPKLRIIVALGVSWIQCDIFFNFSDAFFNCPEIAPTIEQIDLVSYVALQVKIFD